MTRARRGGAEWVVVGGAPGEVGHCTRCGQGLRLELPISLNVFAAASKAFVQDHRHCRPGRYVASTPATAQEWLKSRDTGISSLTIYHVMTGAETVASDFEYGSPSDPSDFGRCYRLLQNVPAWRERLAEVAAKFPAWTPFVREWSTMEQLYNEELPNGTAPRLYKLMKDLEREARPC